MNDDAKATPPVPDDSTCELDPPEPRWPAAIAGAAVGLLYLALPASMSIGPRWLVAVLVVALTIPALITHRRGHRKANLILGFSISTLLTTFLIWSVVLLIRGMIYGSEAPRTMLRSAVALWVSNVLIFALWYWRLDAGGPNGRDLRPGHERGAFLFPQMTEEGFSSIEVNTNRPCWSPQFIDYLFLAFNTSTAFSPTDAPVLSRWAKVLTMIQSGISLAVIALLAARAVNILPTP
jgi:hypothetical protein